MSKVEDQGLFKRVELYKLILAGDSIHSAQQALEIAIQNKIDSNHLLFMPLHNSVVTSYSRPFTEMKPFGKLSSKWGKFTDPKYTQIHKHLIEQRHKNTAHTDYLDSKVVFYPPGALKQQGFDSEGLLYVVKQELYHEQNYGLILEHFKSIRQRLGVKIESMVIELFPNPEEVKQPFELVTDADIKKLAREKAK